MANCRGIILGSGSEATISEEYRDEPNAERRTSPALILIHDDTRILFDCGPDIKQQLSRSGMLSPDICFITHAHPDHIAGINELPESTVKVTQLLEPMPVDHGTMEAFPVEHSKLAPAVAFRFQTDHLKILYCPDFIRIKNEEKVLRDIDLAILDGSSLTRDIARGSHGEIGHQSIKNSIEMCRKYKIRNIIFSHIGKIGADHNWISSEVSNLADKDETIIIAKDGMRLEIDRDFKLLKPKLKEMVSPALTQFPQPLW